jgi:hypothetical protein
MKKTLSSIVLVIFVFTCLFNFTACVNEAENTDLWKDAVYLSDTEIGSGEKVLRLRVEAEDKAVTLTVNTDAATVGAALLENGIVSGDDSEYGLYIKTVNGILADYSVDQSYWAFYIDDNMAATGVDGAELDESVLYRLVYTK